jgi:hypothetical protein
VAIDLRSLKRVTVADSRVAIDPAPLSDEADRVLPAIGATRKSEARHGVADSDGAGTCALCEQIESQLVASGLVNASWLTKAGMDEPSIADDVDEGRRDPSNSVTICHR